MTVMHKAGLPLDGSHPTLMTVYGAYGLCLETGFEPERLALLDRGWVIALAHVRGGGELGRRWVELAKPDSHSTWCVESEPICIHAYNLCIPGHHVAPIIESMSQ